MIEHSNAPFIHDVYRELEERKDPQVKDDDVVFLFSTTSLPSSCCIQCEGDEPCGGFHS
jgi:hypothetical protein